MQREEELKCVVYFFYILVVVVVVVVIRTFNLFISSSAHPLRVCTCMNGMNDGNTMHAARSRM